MRKSTLLFAVLAAVVALAVFAAARWLSGGDSVSAQEVVGRAQAAQTQLLAGLGPDTTFHVVQVDYQADAPYAAEPFGSPQRSRSEFWSYYGPDGKLAALVTETRNADTGTLLQTGQWAGGIITWTDLASGKTMTAPLESAVDDTTSQVLGTVQSDSWNLVAGQQQARSAAVGDVDAYVVDLTWAGGVQRTYFAKTDYRTLKWERLSGDTVIESRETPVFEVVPGNVTPSGAP